VPEYEISAEAGIFPDLVSNMGAWQDLGSY